MNIELEDKIKIALDNVRPFLQSDGGDVMFMELSDDGIVKVKLTGACNTCPLSGMTLRAGIEKAIIREVPGIRRVEAVNN